MILRNLGKSIVPVSSVSTSRISASISCACRAANGQALCSPEASERRRGSEGWRRECGLYLDVEILVASPNARIPGLKGPRAKCTKEGIINSDVILVPLEDGDRCEALVAMGKTVIVIDLNPLSRSAKMGTITIVDELTRVAENMLFQFDSIKMSEVSKTYDNEEALRDALRHIATKFSD